MLGMPLLCFFQLALPSLFRPLEDTVHKIIQTETVNSKYEYGIVNTQAVEFSFSSSGQINIDRSNMSHYLSEGIVEENVIISVDGQDLTRCLTYNPNDRSKPGVRGSVRRILCV